MYKSVGIEGFASVFQPKLKVEKEVAVHPADLKESAWPQDTILRHKDWLDCWMVYSS